jgi:hypothetical protein
MPHQASAGMQPPVGDTSPAPDAPPAGPACLPQGLLPNHIKGLEQPPAIQRCVLHKVVDRHQVALAKHTGPAARQENVACHQVPQAVCPASRDVANWYIGGGRRGCGFVGWWWWWIALLSHNSMSASVLATATQVVLPQVAAPKRLPDAQTSMQAGVIGMEVAGVMHTASCSKQQPITCLAGNRVCSFCARNCLHQWLERWD